MKPHLPLIRRGGKKTPEKKTTPLPVDIRRALLAFGTVVAISALLSLHMLPSKVNLKVGDVSPDTIIAHRTVRYTDTVQTELRRSQAASSAGRVYDPVPSAPDQAVGALKTVLRTVENARREGVNLSTERKVSDMRAKLGSLLGTQVSDRTLKLLLTVDATTLREIEDDSLRIVSSAMSREIHEDPAEFRAARKAVLAEARGIANDAATALAIGEISQAAIRPNQIYNEERTLARQERARQAVPPTHNTIVPGEPVILKGEIVLPEHVEKFEALGLTHPTLDWRSAACTTMFVTLAVALVTLYLRRYYPEVYASTGTLLLLALIVVVSTLALRIGGSMLGIPLSPAQVGYLAILWVVVAGMFLTVLVNQQVAVLITALLSVVVSMILNSELRYASSAFLTSLVGVYSVANIRDRYDQMRAGGALAAVGVLLVWITGGIAGDSLSQMLVGTVYAGVLIPAAAVVLFFFGTVPLERPFGRTTHISLLELADTNRPLLKRLVMEAPGTYTHSMAVGHLAETAAEAIGADSLTARVASYYHDIGKMRRPHFFIENQRLENIHERMNPTLSTLVITSHIKDGLDIAKEYRLPKMVQDVIAQHHGTSLVQYFYSQFTGEQDPSTALEQQFRYSGPKPQTKDAAIVMLADSVEAASRCLDKPTPTKIEMLVNRVVAEKLRDGQLDECDLTFREVSKITSSFTRALVGTMHARIEYPDAVSAEVRKTAVNGSADSEQPKDTGEAETNEELGRATATG